MRTFHLNAVLAALLIAGSATAQTAAPAPAGAASAPAKPSVRSDLAKLLLEAQSLSNDKKYAPAKEKIQAASAFADRSPHENYLIALLTFNIAVGEDDGPVANKQLEQVLALNETGKWAKQSDIIAWLQNAGVVSYRSKDYANAALWMERNIKEGGTSQSVKNVRIQSHLPTNNYARVTELAEEEIALAKTEGRAPTQSHLEMLAQAKTQVKDTPGGTRAVELLVTHYPKKEYWQSLLNRMWNRSDLATALQLDLFRLTVYTNVLQDENDFIEYAKLAQGGGYSAEALAVFDKGVAAGVLGTADNTETHKKLHVKLMAEAEQDRKTSAVDIANALKKPNGQAMVNLGFSLVGQQQFDKGIELMEKGIAKGLPKRPDDARLRLGIAYAMAGQTEKAQQTLATVSGKEGLDELARYWTLALRKP